jgi:phosphatidylserine/phosphatidylglycerophosphate/cardiolipin synthase-like enzyme
MDSGVPYMRKLFLILLFVTSLLSVDKLYFIPDEKKEFQEDLFSLLENAKSSIKIAMYNFEHKKLARVLKKKSRNGIDVTVFYYKKDVEFYKKIDAIKVERRKLHTKLAIIDNETIVFGSSNWSKKSFKKNYEMNYITDREELVSKSIKFFENIKE